MVMLIAGGPLLQVLTTRIVAHRCRLGPSTPSVQLTVDALSSTL